MIPLLALVALAFALAVVVLSVLGLAGIGPLTEERRADRGSLPGAIGPAVGLVVGGGLLVVMVAGALLVVGVDTAGDTDGRNRRETRRTPSRTPDGGAVRVATLGPEVTVEADDDASFPESYEVADRLGPATVLRMLALGFAPFERAVAEQCASEGIPRCGNPIPVQFDEDGEARFQFLITDDFRPLEPVRGRCRADAAPCTIVVRSVDGDRRGAVQTIFVDRIRSPGRIEVTPSSGLSLDGERVTVEVHDYPPGARVTAMLCAAPDATGPRCGDPGPAAPLRVGSDGTGRAQLLVEPGPVGSEEVRCARGDDCGVSVASDAVFVRAPVVPISFAAPPGAAYDPTRLALGLALAALFVAIAAGLILRTDWSPTGEAAAPEIDDADYADLDAIIAALPPEEPEDDLVPTR